MVGAGNEHGHIDKSEQNMIENIFVFDTLTAADVCTYRLDVVALPLDADYQAVLNVLTENYSRIPVYEESLDNVKGILHAKDVMHYMVNNTDTTAFHLESLLREPYFVPLSKKASTLFQEMRKRQAYIAIVIDEYGGTMGIVTMEDLVEEIVGSIQDEYDTDEQPDIISLGDDVFRIQGTAFLEVVQDFFDVSLPIDEHETLSGFLVHLLGYIPEDDERPKIVFDGLEFDIEVVQEKRIAEVLVMRSAEATSVEGELKK
jgi:putative hemolysin